MLRRQLRERNRRRWITLGVVLGIAVGIIAIGSRTEFITPVRDVLLLPLSPLARLLNIGTQTVIDAATEEELATVEELQDRNLEYESLIAQMQVELVQLREIEQDYERLAGLLDYTIDNPTQSLVTADVIAVDTSAYLRRIIINRGTRDGVQIGQAVITDLGLVGRVEGVTANAAWVRLLIDEQSAINARLQEAGVEGTIVGQLRGGLRMIFIPQIATVEEGDVVMTSGLGGIMPSTIVIGQVTGVQRLQAQLFQEAEVRSIVDFDNLTIVSVITGFESIDIQQFEALDNPEE